MKRKRDVWDFGESIDLYNTDQGDLARNLAATYSPDKLDLAAEEVGEGEIKIPEIPDLVQRRQYRYALQRDKRTPGTGIVRDIRLFLPDFLRESLWRRHRYSLRDVISALKACPKEYIWQLALYYNVQILNSASRPSSCFIIRGCKSSAIDRTEKEFLKEGSPFKAWRQRPSVLLKTRSCYKDPMHLPFHFIGRQTLNLLVDMLPEEESGTTTATTWLGQPLRHYRRYAKWRYKATEVQGEEEEIALVPLSVYWRVLPQYDFVLLNRVLPYEAYCRRYGQNTSRTPLSEWTDLVYIGDRRFALLEEAFYVVYMRPE